MLGLAADARNEKGLLSIQTPLLEVGSYDLSNAMPGISCLYTSLFLQYMVTCSVATAFSLEKTNSLILERPCVWSHTIVVEM